MLSLPGAVERFGNAMEGQLDFQDEVKNNRRFAELFRDTPEIGVPDIYPELCTKKVLTMEMIHGCVPQNPRKLRRPNQFGENRFRRCPSDGVPLWLRSCGLHPGNILVTQEGRVILIDLGLVAEIPDDMKRPWLETFRALFSGCRGGGSSLLRICAHGGTGELQRYEADVREHFHSFAGKNLGQVEATAVLGDDEYSPQTSGKLTRSSQWSTSRCW